jgi:hypothetical protein
MVLDYPKALELIELFADYGFDPLGDQALAVERLVEQGPVGSSFFGGLGELITLREDGLITAFHCHDTAAALQPRYHSLLYAWGILVDEDGLEIVPIGPRSRISPLAVRQTLTLL